MDKSGLTWDKYDRLAHKITHALVSRSHKQGQALPYADVYQEVFLVWVRCVENYDPDTGNKFSTYFFRACLHQYLKIRASLLGKNADHTVSLDAGLNTSNGEDSLTLLDVIEDRSVCNPEATAMLNERAEQHLAQQPGVAFLLGLIADPPPELARHLEAMRAQAMWARDLGAPLPHATPTMLTPAMLIKLFGLNWRHRQLLVQGLEMA